MPKVLEPSKELRFSRGRQALFFALLACVFLAAVVTMLLITYTVHNSIWGLAELPFPLWSILIPGCLCVLCVYLCIHCLRHPYLILSPSGVEIFPFWRPIKNFNMVEWGRIHEAEIEDEKLTLHYDAERTGGVVLGLAPLSKKSRILLQEAVQGVMQKRKI